jgi:hypothetical protein
MDSSEPKQNESPEAQSPHSHDSPTISADMSDEEKQQHEADRTPEKVSAFKGLGWLDRFLAVWILLAMIIGVLLGNFVENVGPALQRGKFVGVSISIGECHCYMHDNLEC